MDIFESILSANPTEARERRVHGLVTARVSAILGDHTCELEYLSMGEGEPSSPARVMMPMAGDRRGAFFHPEVGDEVVVAFEHGDVNRPIVLGGVYNDQSPPPDQADTSPDNNVRTIVSRSGHEVTLDDSPGAQRIVIRSQGGHEITIEDVPAGKITVQTATCAVELNDAGGQLTLRAPTMITLESATISLAAQSIQMTGGGGVGVTADLGRLQITAPTQIQLQSAGIVMQTTNVVTSSAVIVDGKPFGLHMHTEVGGPMTGPVSL